jgi:hypothetical protein
MNVSISLPDRFDLLAIEEKGEATHMGRFGPRTEVDAPPREEERKGVTAKEHDTEQESPFCVTGASNGRTKCRVSWFCSSQSNL